MEHSEIDLGVREVFATVLERGVAPDEEIERAQEARWDSLKHMELIFSVEEKFDVRFSEREMAQLATLSAITDAVRQQLETRNSS